MTTRIHAFGLGSLFAVSLCARPALAVELGVGLMGTIGGNFQNKPDRTATDPDLNPGFGGMTAGGGLLADLRIMKGLLGLEVDVLRTSDRGTGTVRFSTPLGSTEYKLKIGQSAWHVPILPKLTIPSEVVAPMFFLGPEVVLPSDGDASLDGPGAPSCRRAGRGERCDALSVPFHRGRSERMTSTRVCSSGSSNDGGGAMASRWGGTSERTVVRASTSVGSSSSAGGRRESRCAPPPWG